MREICYASGLVGEGLKPVVGRPGELLQGRVRIQPVEDLDDPEALVNELQVLRQRVRAVDLLLDAARGVVLFAVDPLGSALLCRNAALGVPRERPAEAVCQHVAVVVVSRRGDVDGGILV